MAALAHVNAVNAMLALAPLTDEQLTVLLRYVMEGVDTIKTWEWARVPVTFSSSDEPPHRHVTWFKLAAPNDRKLTEVLELRKLVPRMDQYNKPMYVTMGLGVTYKFNLDEQYKPFDIRMSKWDHVTGLASIVVRPYRPVISLNVYPSWRRAQPQ
eukprot:1820154-Karenia_brevis.AAC.1